MFKNRLPQVAFSIRFSVLEESMWSYFPTEKITFQSAPSPQEFTEGDTADIVCNVVSSPPPTIIWKHKGSKIQAAKDGEPVQIKLLLCLSSFLTSEPPCHPILLTPWAVTSLPVHAFQSIFHTLPLPPVLPMNKVKHFQQEVVGELIDDWWKGKVFFFWSRKEEMLQIERCLRAESNKISPKEEER